MSVVRENRHKNSVKEEQKCWTAQYLSVQPAMWITVWRWLRMRCVNSCFSAFINNGAFSKDKHLQHRKQILLCWFLKHTFQLMHFHTKKMTQIWIVFLQISRLDLKSKSNINTPLIFKRSMFNEEQTVISRASPSLPIWPLHNEVEQQVNSWIYTRSTRVWLQCAALHPHTTLSSLQILKIHQNYIQFKQKMT